MIYGAQADRGARRRAGGRRCPLVAGLALGAAVRAPAAAARRPDDRPALFRRPALQRRARREHARLLRRRSARSCSSRSTSSSCSGCRRWRRACGACPAAAGFVAGSHATPPLAARIRPATVMLGGILVALAGVAAAHPGGPAAEPLPVVAAATIVSVGLAPLFTLADRHRRSAARRPSARARRPGSRRRAPSSAARWASRCWGRSATAVYPRRRGARRDCRQRGRESAGETLGGAVDAAAQLPPAARAELLESARDAFTHGLQVAATVSGVVIALAALLVATVLRRAGPEQPAAAPARVAVPEPCA